MHTYLAAKREELPFLALEEHVLAATACRLQSALLCDAVHSMHGVSTWSESKTMEKKLELARNMCMSSKMGVHNHGTAITRFEIASEIGSDDETS
jgi:hypothetical protein